MNNNKTIKHLLSFAPFLLAMLLAPMASQAKLGGYNLVLVHGFISDDIYNKPGKEELLARRKVSTFWQDRAEANLNWSGAQRIEGGIAQFIYEQAVTFAKQGLCDQGCVFLTHSTGDLVMRYFLANQAAWLRSAGYEPLNIVATLDFAGAGGGTGLADVAVGTVTGGSMVADHVWAVNMMWDLNLTSMTRSQLGVINDLTTSGARSLANWPMSTPRLRFSVDGGNLLELGMGQVRAVTKTILIGSDDTVVPAHSTCGASSPYIYESCSKHVDYEGKRGWEIGPGSFMHNHFPVLMAHDYDHFQITQDEHQGLVTYVMNNFNANGVNVDFNTYRRTVDAPWWDWWTEEGTWQYVTGSDYKSLSRLVYQTLKQ